MVSDYQDIIDNISEVLDDDAQESAQSLLAKEMRGQITHAGTVYALEERSLRYRNLLIRVQNKLEKLQREQD